MYFDRFDIVTAFYLHFMLNHGGQWSKLYALSGTFHRLGFRPSVFLSGPEDLEENARAIYDALADGSANIRDRRGA